MSTTNGRVGASVPRTSSSDRVARWERRSRAWASDVAHLLLASAVLFLLACVVAGRVLFTA